MQKRPFYRRAARIPFPEEGPETGRLRIDPKAVPNDPRKGPKAKEDSPASSLQPRIGRTSRPKLPYGPSPPGRGTGPGVRHRPLTPSPHVRTAGRPFPAAAKGRPEAKRMRFPAHPTESEARNCSRITKKAYF